jgi:hypothetical protein
VKALEHFATTYGLETQLLQKTLSRALQRGGDFADIYVEHRHHNSLSLEEGLVKESSEAVALGAGVRKHRFRPQSRAVGGGCTDSIRCPRAGSTGFH